jgi:hypothetical protein
MQNFSTYVRDSYYYEHSNFYSKSMTYSNHLLPIPIYKGDTCVPADKDDVE